MPLIVIAGNPCTGKTTFANILVNHLKTKGIVHVDLVNEESLNITKQVGYQNSFHEKSTRSSLKSSVDHKLNADQYIIMDSLNYIKGFRYELYCSARTYRTPHCVVWIDCSEETALLLNQQKTDCYDEQV